MKPEFTKPVPLQVFPPLGRNVSMFCTSFGDPSAKVSSMMSGGGVSPSPTRVAVCGSPSDWMMKLMESPLATVISTGQESLDANLRQSACSSGHFP